MRIFVAICAAALAAGCFLPAALPAHEHSHCDDENDLFREDGVSIDVEDSSIVFTREDSDDKVEMTDAGVLVVNGRPVKLDRDERELVVDYYETYQCIIDEAKAIGLQGAKIGVKGAALGLKAALGTLLRLSPDYDEEDLEEALEDEGDDLEHIAEKLEKRAKRLEKKADSLERIHKKLRREVTELDELGWF